MVHPGPIVAVALLMAVAGCDKARVQPAEAMRLRVISDYGATERVVSEDVTPEAVGEVMRSLDWKDFHQVVLEQPNGDWLEVGGSLDPSDGLSAMYEEGGRQFVIMDPPTAVHQMTALLLRYLAGDETWKESAEWR